MVGTNLELQHAIIQKFSLDCLGGTIMHACDLAMNLGIIHRKDFRGKYKSLCDNVILANETNQSMRLGSDHSNC